jgi:hypothetical protein
VSAIYVASEVPAKWQSFIVRNAEFFG